MSKEKDLNAEAVGALTSADWAITESGLAEVRGNFRTLPALVAQNSHDKALEAYQSERLDSTFTVKVRDGVAIIPITGPIFDSFNWYMYYYGGTCMSFLARDLQACIDNPNVHAILLKFHTPGGTVTGVNEMGKMIRAARKLIPITSYAFGHMCSAGLWLGVQAGDVIVDETAVVGSLGVCTAYMDARKFLEKLGFEELEFISSQSPFKNAPPYEDEGKKRIQTRLNAICDVFGSEVGLGRGVDVETVWKDFGQGDVFVGQAAVDAGIADSCGSFEETLALLSKTHAPHLYRGERAANELPTLNLSTDLDSETAEDAAAKSENDAPEPIQIESVENLNKAEEKIMSEKNQESNAGATAATETAKAPEAPAAIGDTGALTAQIESLTAQLTKSNERAEQEAAARKTAEEATAKLELENAMEKVAEGFAGDKAKKKDFLVKLAETFGKDSAEVAEYIEDQKALNAQVESGDLFTEQGSSAANGDKESAEAKVEKLAKERATKDGCSYEQAYAKILNENPKLYSAIDNEVIEPSGE